MTEDLENVIQGDEPITDANEQPVETEAERLFNSSQVKKVVEREKAKAFERGKREALMQAQIEQQIPAIEQQQTAPMQQQPAAPVFNGQSQGIGGMQQMTPADIERMIAEQAPQALQQHVQKLQQDQMVNTFVQKMQLAEQQYPGLEAELNNLNYSDPRIHSFIMMANQLENTGDIMKEVLDESY